MHKRKHIKTLSIIVCCERTFGGVVAPPRKLFTNWTKVSLRTTRDWRIKFKRANKKHSSKQVLQFPLLEGNDLHLVVHSVP